MSIQELLIEIAKLPNSWHGAGTVTHEVLEAIAKHAKRIGNIEYSCETGSGRSTLLFSHLSASHTVFAVDMDNSISQVRQSPLFNSTTTQYVEMPTQRSLPNHSFTNKHQVVLIDGPHGYPFPDLEFYFLYPTIAEGGLLIIDDIRIPSIRRMSDIIAAGPMFELVETVSGNTAFFCRTNAPLLNPEGDDWWLLNYNKSYYQELLDPAAKSLKARCIHWVADKVSPSVRSRIPKHIRDYVWRIR